MNHKSRFHTFYFIFRKIWILMKIYLIRKQIKISEIIGFARLHFEATQEHSALFLQNCSTPLNRFRASRSVLTSDFFS